MCTGPGQPCRSCNRRSGRLYSGAGTTPLQHCRDFSDRPAWATAYIAWLELALFGLLESENRSFHPFSTPLDLAILVLRSGMMKRRTVCAKHNIVPRRADSARLISQSDTRPPIPVQSGAVRIQLMLCPIKEACPIQKPLPAPLTEDGADPMTKDELPTHVRSITAARRSNSPRT